MADHLTSHNSSHNLSKPKKAKGKRMKITTKNPPGGPQTPGAKAKAEAQNTDSNNPAR